MTKHIDVNTLRDWLDARQPVTVIDVRSEEDRAQWAIPGSVHVNAYEALGAGSAGALDDFIAPDAAPIVIVCNAGKMSQRAADVLSARGFDARSLVGGMRAWSLAWNTADVPLPEPATATVVQLRRTGKGCLSYIVASDNDAVVIDPALPADVFVNVSAARGWQIRHVIETHIHADHLSRARQLVERTDAQLVLPRQHRVVFPFIPIADGESISFGRARLTALSTPGHTDESTSYLVDDVAVFTGDTVFTNGVGRPDLHADPVEARRRAAALFASLQRLAALSPSTLVLPAHANEPIPFDRQPIAARMTQVRSWLRDWLVSEQAFVDRVLSKLPASPANFARIIDLNEHGDMPLDDPAELESGANRCAVR